MKKIIAMFFILLVSAMQAQIIKMKHEKEKIAEVKSKTLYFVLGKENEEFRSIVNKFWSFSKFKIITEDEVMKNFDVNNIFFTGATMKGYNSPGTATISSEYLMWSPKERAVAKGKELKNLLGSTDQYYDIKVEGDYWYGGFFKNFLQQMQEYMGTFLAKGEAEDVPDPKKIAELKSTTLYVPNYIVKKEDVSEMFSKYPYKYEMIASEDLNKKILAGENVYYMLTCIYGTNCKIISVVNAQSGQRVYYSLEAKPIYPYLRKNDIAVIAKLAEKASK